MSAELALIDTNVLVYALFAQRDEHAASLALLESDETPVPSSRWPHRISPNSIL